MKNAFDTFDEDGSGDIDLSELIKIVRGEAMGRSDLTRDDIKVMMNEFDYQKNGTITFAGFLEMMSPRRERARNKYMNDLQELKKRATVTGGLDSGDSIIFRSQRNEYGRSPRPPSFSRNRRSGGSGIRAGRGRKSRQGQGRVTPRIGTGNNYGTMGRSGASNGTEDIDDWIEESRGARGTCTRRPPSTMLPEVSYTYNNLRP